MNTIYCLQLNIINNIIYMAQHWKNIATFFLYFYCLQIILLEDSCLPEVFSIHKTKSKFKISCAERICEFQTFCWNEAFDRNFEIQCYNLFHYEQTFILSLFNKRRFSCDIRLLKTLNSPSFLKTPNFFVFWLLKIRNIKSNTL